MNQGTEWGLLMKKNRSKKSRASVPLRSTYWHTIEIEHIFFGMGGGKNGFGNIYVLVQWYMQKVKRLKRRT